MINYNDCFKDYMLCYDSACKEWCERYTECKIKTMENKQNE